MKNPTLFLLLTLPAAALPEAKFRAVTIDAEVKIGYGIAISDVDGDGKPDIILADTAETVWYKNPDWKKSRLSEKLTQKDNVCVAARDTDGDAKAEIAIGAEWDPGDTLKSGAVFSLTPPADRTQLWKAEPQHHEPTVHRMNWVREPDRYVLAVLPLHGCGNKNGGGDGIRFLGYRPVAGREWETFLINESFHMAHNFQPVLWNPGDSGESLLVAEKEGVHLVSHSQEKWTAERLTDHGSGEVRLGKNPNGSRFIAAIEPMHGTDVAIYPEHEKKFTDRILLDSTLNQGHALVAADFLGTGSDQVAAGWREPGKEGKKVGIRLYAPISPDGGKWQLHATIDDDTMACEDMKSADLNGDGRPDLIASGRATKNLVIYWNETEKP